MSDNVLSVQQFKAKRWEKMLDSVQTPQEQIDALPKTTPKPPERKRALRIVR